MKTEYGFELEDEDIIEVKVDGEEPEVFIMGRFKKKKEQVSSPYLIVWKNAFEKCSTLSDYQKYILRYNDSENPYLTEAKEKVKELTEAIHSIESGLEQKQKNNYGYRSHRTSKAKNLNDDQTFAKCKTIEDFQRYLSLFPSGKHVLGARSKIRLLSNPNTPESNELSDLIKKAICIIAFIIAIALLIGCIVSDLSWSIFAGYFICIFGPVCKWANK